MITEEILAETAHFNFTKWVSQHEPGSLSRLELQTDMLPLGPIDDDEDDDDWWE